MHEEARELPEYLVGEVEEALARDPRVNELGLHVRVVGDRLFVTGTVSTEERRAAVAAVAEGAAPGHPVVNEVVVAELGEPLGREVLR